MRLYACDCLPAVSDARRSIDGLFVRDGLRLRAEAPAHVEAPRHEAELTTVKLSPEAVKRLGTQTAVVKIDTAAATRSLGGEVTVPEGRMVTVSAPVAGTLSMVSGMQPGIAYRAEHALMTLDRSHRLSVTRASRHAARWKRRRPKPRQPACACNVSNSC